ncbi:MAG: AbrB/MazE/SpoVT family DNA-binding domain-containing protein [Deltaproteobacteria bacterium]|nr:AbrB/MazE/SpoVT family DNA-binding domain-containing protein [Deltaproteobacteria bacterium]
MREIPRIPLSSAEIVKVLKGYRITIPKHIREREKIKEGDKLVIGYSDVEVVIRKIGRN